MEISEAKQFAGDVHTKLRTLFSADDPLPGRHLQLDTCRRASTLEEDGGMGDWPAPSK